MSHINEMKHLRVHVLASGSKGNCTIVEYGDTVVMHDAGISARRITQGFKALGIEMNRLSGIFISHEHTDHIAGLFQMLKQYDVPVYTKNGTWREINRKMELPKSRFIPITKSSIIVGDLIVEPFSVSHDVADPIGTTFLAGHEKAAVMTDTGTYNDTMLRYLDDTNKLVLEANYDPYLLRTGFYAPYLKQRVAGKLGHLSNEDTAGILLSMNRPKYMEVVLAHRSENNNTQKHVTQTIGNLLVDGGINIGGHMYLQHGQPNVCVSMTEERKCYDSARKSELLLSEMETRVSQNTGSYGKAFTDTAEQASRQGNSLNVEKLAEEMAAIRRMMNGGNDEI